MHFVQENLIVQCLMISDSNFNLTAFNSLDSQQQRLRLLSQTAEVGDWQYILKTNITLWSEYLYNFYELDKTFNCSELLEKTTLYQKLQKEKMLNFIDQAISTKTQCREEFMVLMDDGRHKWHATTIYPILDASGNVISLYGVLQNISLTKQAEENNKKKHQFYNYILDRLPTELVVLDDKGRYIYANHVAIKSKERRGFVIGVNKDAYHEMGNWAPATESRRNEVMNECMTSKESVIFEEAFTGSDGIVRTYIRNMYPLLDENDEVEFLVGHGMDITALKKAKETSFKHQQAIENAMDGIALLDNSGNFYFMNTSYVTIFGYKNPQEQIGKTLHDFYPDHEIERINNQISPILEQTGSWNGEILGKKKDGSVVFQEITLTRLADGGMICICRDITTRKKNELELKRMAIVAEKTNGIVMITDPERRVVWINNSFERILGYTSEEVIGIDPGFFLQGPETSLETVQEIARSLQETGTFSGEILNYTKNGSKIWLYLDIAAVYNEAGSLINYVAVENDITLIKKAEQRLQIAIERERELNRFKTQFVSLASHQFRTPLATIRSSIDLLDLKMESEALNDSYVAFFHKHKTIMAEETTRMTELMENILDIGRIEEGKIELSKKKLSFKRFMDEFVTSNSEPNGQQRKLKYLFDSPDQIVNIDEILLRNILRNVVSNAFKYSENRQAPELTISCYDHTYFITIKDYGIGIPEKDQPFIFQSFFRASNAKAFTGSGLGLMIAQKLIILHGGDIDIKSKMNRGSTVTIKLPI